MKKSDFFWQTYLNLEKEFLLLSKYVYITDEVFVNSPEGKTKQTCTTQLETFSSYIADLLINCSVQIEALSKEIYYENGGEKLRGDRSIFFDTDCLKLIDKKWNMNNKKVLVVSPHINLTKEENRVLKPLRNAHKQQGTFWEKAYQAVKHDRFSCIQQGNIKAFLHALAALYLLNVYYKNDCWITQFNDIKKIDYSLGSSLFTVLPPLTTDLINGEKPISEESPYIVRYQDDAIREIDKIKHKEEQDLIQYFLSQPELHEIDFINQMNEAKERERLNPYMRVIPIWELAKYRLNKKIPKTLSFAERKALFIHTEEWNGVIRQNNPHKTEDELTEDNLQEEIDSAGNLWGLELSKRYQPLRWLDIALHGNVCRIFIPMDKNQ